MRNLPLNIQILASPLVLAVPIIAILISTLVYLDDISEQNDLIREWARATDQFKIAKSANYQMLEILQTISKIGVSDKSEQKEELFFNYIEQSQFLRTSLTSPDIVDKVSEADFFLFSTILEKAKYSERINITEARTHLETLSPKLDYIYNTLQAKKRSLYLQSNKDITEITSKLTSLILFTLGGATLLAIIIAAIVSTHLKKRLSSINKLASNILDGNKVNQTIKSTEARRDDLDSISDKLIKISLRLNNSLESSKILQAAEDERQRIAMDIHDQFLSEVTQLRRSIDKSQSDNVEQQLNTIDTTLGRLNNDLRGLINDLFPHSLEMLGLEASLRDFINRKVTSTHNLDFYVQIDDNIDSKLTQQQCLHLYRISIEAINNILKHAHCNRFELVFNIINDNLILSIEDNGCGFKFDDTPLRGRMGLLSIKQRAQILEAELNWSQSRFSSGTCVKITLKLPVSGEDKTIDLHTLNTSTAYT